MSIRFPSRENQGGGSDYRSLAVLVVYPHLTFNPLPTIFLRNAGDLSACGQGVAGLIHAPVLDIKPLEGITIPGPVLEHLGDGGSLVPSLNDSIRETSGQGEVFIIVDVHELGGGSSEHGEVSYPYRAFGQGWQLHPRSHVLGLQFAIDGFPPLMLA